MPGDVVRLLSAAGRCDQGDGAAVDSSSQVAYVAVEPERLRDDDDGGTRAAVRDRLVGPIGPSGVESVTSPVVAVLMAAL